MFPIPFCQSIGIHVLLVIVFGITEFPVYGNSVPANETCVNISGEIICYFKGSEQPLAWNEAKRLCTSFNSALPVIRNGIDQDAVAGYLKSHTNKSTVWTAGRSITHSNWIWINGKLPKESDQVKLQRKGIQNGKVYAALKKNVTLTTLASNERLSYICQYNGTYCNSSSDVIVNDKCFRLINDKRTWYDARNQCLLTNGDLAIIGEEDHGHLRNLTSNKRYWIGLRKISWRWFRNDTESRDEIKYTNWNSSAFSKDGQYISIAASDGKWKAIGENETMGVVCQRGQSETSAVTTETSVENITRKEESFTSTPDKSTTFGSQGSISESSAFSNETTTYGSQGAIPGSSAFSDETTTYGSQGAIPGSSAFSDETTTYGSQGAIPGSSAVSDQSTTFGSQGSIPERSAVSEESTTYGSQGSIPERSAVSEESTTFGSQGSIPERSAVSEESTTFGSQGSIPERSAVSEESTTYGSPVSTPQILLFAVVGPAIVIIICIICIIVVVFMLRKRKRSGSYNFRIIGDSQFNSRTSLNHGEELDSRTTKAPFDTFVNDPANAPVESSDEIRGFYVEIPFSAFNQSDDGDQQPEIVYASLEWKKEPTCLEPDENCDHTTAPTKTGPLEDIYTMPYATGHKDISPDNVSGGSDSHPIEVTEQEVVYALPMKTSKSSTPYNPDEVVYDNLQTEMFG